MGKGGFTRRHGVNGGTEKCVGLAAALRPAATGAQSPHKSSLQVGCSCVGTALLLPLAAKPGNQTHIDPLVEAAQWLGFSPQLRDLRNSAAPLLRGRALRPLDPETDTI